MSKLATARLAAVVAALCVVSSLPAFAAGERLHAVRVEGAVTAAVDRLALSPSFRADYGSFRWLEIDDADLARLVAAALPFTEEREAGEIRFLDVRFDPLRDGEPRLAPGERADPTGSGLRLIQLRGPVQDGWLRTLELAGLPLLQYYPQHTFLTWSEPSTIEPIAALPFVRWHGTFHPAYKIAPQLSGRTGVVRNVDVVFYDDGAIEATLARIAELGGKVLRFHPSQPDRRLWEAIVELPADAFPAVARLAPVLFLGHESPHPTLDDEMSGQIVAGNHPGGVPMPGYLAHLATLGVDGTGVTWAIVDTGVDYDHPDLGSHIVGGYDFPGACVVAGQPGADCPDGGHGTHVAGIVGGNAAGGFADPAGFKYGLGIAPGVGLFAMNSATLSAPWPPAGGWQEHSKRALLGAAIGGNNSWTTGEGMSHGYQASERTHDFMVRDGNFDTLAVAEPFIEVFSAGNSGPGAGTLNAPKEAKNLIVTAASANYRVGSIDTLASFSSRGPAVDGRIVPTITAPGDEIASTRNDTGGIDCSAAIAGTNNLYAFCTGTSMAAPHVSGAVALATQWWRTLHAGANPSPAMAKALLVNSAVDMGTPDIPSFSEGWGRVQITELLQPGVPRVVKEQDAARTFAATGELVTITIGIADLAEPIKVTLAWSDAPGAIGASPALVNDLDLEVDLDGITYRGNVFAAGWSTSGGVADTRNNLENVYLAAPTAASAVIRVRATQIAGDGVPLNADATDQDFALVCTNCVEQPDFTLTATPAELRLCAPAEAVYALEIGSLLGYTSPVALSLAGAPAGTTTDFSVNPASPASPPTSSTLKIGNTAAAVAGTYALTLSGIAEPGPNVKNLPLGLALFTASPTAPTLTAPADGALDQALRPLFQWTAGSQAESYQIEIASDPAFTSLVLVQAGTGTTFTAASDLASGTRYYWRVRNFNPCGTGALSGVSTFTTRPQPGDCGLGTVPQLLFTESFDGPVTGWAHDGTGDSWALSTVRFHSGTSSYHAVDPTTVGDQRLTSPAIALPVAGSSATLQFWNYQALESRAGGCYDAGILEISTDGGAIWSQALAARMLTDPYDGPVSGSFSNPLANLDGWCGDPQDWLASVVDLDGYAGATVRFRFRLGSDTTASREGWYLDDVKVQVCLPDPTLFRDGFETGTLSVWSAVTSN